MANDLIKAGDISLADSTVFSVTVTADAIIFYTIKGHLSVECRHSRFVLRDYLAGQPTNFSPGPSCGRCDYGVTAAVLSRRQPRQLRNPPVVDNVPVKDGWFAIETTTRSEYHPWCSLQLVCLDRCQRLFICLSTITYQCCVPPESEMRSIFNRITGSGKSCHCTVHPIGAYWLPSNRNHFERINEVPDIPEKLDGFLAVADYRRIPEHTAFAAKVAKIADRTGPGIDL